MIRSILLIWPISQFNNGTKAPTNRTMEVGERKDPVTTHGAPKMVLKVAR
jgi:hypothetical protein